MKVKFKREVLLGPRELDIIAKLVKLIILEPNRLLI